MLECMLMVSTLVLDILQTKQDDIKTLHYTASFDDRRKAEAEAHRIAGTIAEEQKNEWFKMDTKSAIDIISSLN